MHAYRLDLACDPAQRADVAAVVSVLPCLLAQYAGITYAAGLGDARRPGERLFNHAEPHHLPR